MARFSDRAGFTEDPGPAQVDNLDPGTRDALWNVVEAEVAISVSPAGSPQLKAFVESPSVLVATGIMSALRPPLPTLLPFVRRLWVDLWDVRASTVSDETPGQLLAAVELVFVDGQLSEVFDAIEVLVECVSERDPSAAAVLITRVNSVAERRNIAYRLVSGSFLPVTDDLERDAIEIALVNAADYEGPREQLKRAHRLLRHEEWASSIQAAINAAEGAARIALDDDRPTLGAALVELHKSGAIPPAFRNAWRAFYGYTSNDNRHGGRYDSTADRKTATFFLIGSSAFVSYLLSSVTH